MNEDCENMSFDVEGSQFLPLELQDEFVFSEDLKSGKVLSWEEKDVTLSEGVVGRNERNRLVGTLSHFLHFFILLNPFPGWFRQGNGSVKTDCHVPRFSFLTQTLEKRMRLKVIGERELRGVIVASGKAFVNAATESGDAQSPAWLRQAMFGKIRNEERHPTKQQSGVGKCNHRRGVLVAVGANII